MSRPVESISLPERCTYCNSDRPGCPCEATYREWLRQASADQIAEQEAIDAYYSELEASRWEGLW